MRNTELEFYRSRAQAVARYFEYGTDVLKRIKNAETEKEITDIMINARHEKWSQ